jgi:tetratricopeptide (TPR) repeat protein
MSIASNIIVKAGALVLALAIAGVVAPAFAAGGNNSSATSTTTPPVDCVKQKGAGWAYSEQDKKCVKKTALNDSELYAQGRALALAGNYDSALDALTAIHNQHDAMVLTMIGYSKRKLGFTDEGIALYHQALAIDPNNVNTHEYLGEGYVIAGRVDLAKLELVTLQNLCGVDCEQYKDLNGALNGVGGTD